MRGLDPRISLQGRKIAGSSPAMTDKEGHGQETMSGKTIRLTMAQAVVRYLAAQRGEIDGKEVPLIAGTFAIFGHGNVAGMGEALAAAEDVLPTYRAHNE